MSIRSLTYERDAPSSSTVIGDAPSSSTVIHSHRWVLHVSSSLCVVIVVCRHHRHTGIRSNVQIHFTIHVTPLLETTCIQRPQQPPVSCLESGYAMYDHSYSKTPQFAPRPRLAFLANPHSSCRSAGTPAHSLPFYILTTFISQANLGINFLPRNCVKLVTFL